MHYHRPACRHLLLRPLHHPAGESGHGCSRSRVAGRSTGDFQPARRLQTRWGRLCNAEAESAGGVRMPRLTELETAQRRIRKLEKILAQHTDDVLLVIHALDNIMKA